MHVLRTTLQALAALLCLAACAPVVTHGPRVQPGRELSVAVGWRWEACDSCGAGLVPPIGTVARYGWTPDGPDGAAYSVGALVPGFIFIPLSTLDVYAQAPVRANGIVFGGGLSAGVMDVMPYVQVGRQDADGDGWYTTQGFVWAAYRAEPEVFLNGSRGSVFERVSATYWSPTVSYRQGEITLYASGALGTHDGGAEVGTGPRRPVRSLLFGFVLHPPNPRDLLPRGSPLPRRP